MIWLLVYLLGVIIAGICVYQEVKKRFCQVTLNDALLFICFSLLSWVLVIVWVLLWLTDKGGEIILWEKK